MNNMDKSDIPQIKPEKNENDIENKTTLKDPVINAQKKEQVFVPKISPNSSKYLGNEDSKSSDLNKNNSLETGNIKKERLKFNIRSKWMKIGSPVLTIFLIISLLFLNVSLKAKKVLGDVGTLKSSIKGQNLKEIGTQLDNLKTSMGKLQKSYKTISWLRYVPFFGGYIKDGGHIINAGIYGIDSAQMITKTIEPYADLIGFSGGEKVAGGEKTAADRIDFIVETLPDIMPQIDGISGKVDLVRGEVDNINPKRYPVKFAGKEVRSKLEKFISLADEGSDLFRDAKPLIQEAPYLLGLDSERTYLVIFQNDKELRPTGGFITSYSIMKVDRAKFEPIASDDIYHLDAKYKPSVPAPDPIRKYIKGPYVLQKNLYLRDMNWSPDFEESMKTFVDEVKTVDINDFDGVIAVDTQALVYILDVLGPIGVPGFGNYSTKIVPECHCPQVIYELESFADIEGPIVWDPSGNGKIIYAPPNSDNRKKVIGPLMNSIFANALGQPKEKLSDLFKAGFKSLMEKHVLFYLLDSDAQKAAVSFGIAGRVKNFDGDYLFIDDANLGGRKSNLYVKEEVSQDINIAKDGSVEKTLTITYKNPEKHDGWLNSVLPNWVRIYVPKGSHLVSIDGLEDKEDPYEEFGKTVFAGYFELRPQGVVKVVIKYKLPFKVEDKYSLFVQKQAGKDSPLYQINLGKKQEEFFLKSDKKFIFNI